MLQRIIIFLFIAGFGSQICAAEVDENAPGKLPLPRFVSLKTDEVNVRTGPGTRYGISWIFKHGGLPVEVIQEFDQWREIRDQDGSIGWVHKSMLSGRRTVLIDGEVRVLRRIPEENGPPVLRAEPGVKGQLIECEKDWCRIQVQSRKGWIPKAHIWGVYAKEIF